MAAEKERPNRAKRLKDASVGWVLDRGLSVLVPWIVSIWAAVLSYLEQSPMALLVLLASLVFWAVASGMNSFDLFINRRSPQSKLVFGNPLMNLNVDGQTQKIKGLQFGFEIANNADFPIEYQVDLIESSIFGRINPDPVHVNRGTVLEARSKSAHWDAHIPYDDTMAGKRLEGSLQVRLRYGRPGRLRYENSRAVQLIAYIGDQGKISFSWMAKPALST